MGDGNVPYREEKRAEAYSCPGGRAAAAPQRARHAEHPAQRYGRRTIPRPPAAPVRAAASGREGETTTEPDSLLPLRRGEALPSPLCSPAVPGKPEASGGISPEPSGHCSRPPRLSSPRGRRANAALGAVPARPGPSRAPMAAEMAAEPPPPPSPRPEGSRPGAGREEGDCGMPRCRSRWLLLVVDAGIGSWHSEKHGTSGVFHFHPTVSQWSQYLDKTCLGQGPS